MWMASSLITIFFFFPNRKLVQRTILRRKFRSCVDMSHFRFVELEVLINLCTSFTVLVVQKCPEELSTGTLQLPKASAPALLWVLLSWQSCCRGIPSASDFVQASYLGSCGTQPWTRFSHKIKHYSPNRRLFRDPFLFDSDDQKETLGLQSFPWENRSNVLKFSTHKQEDILKLTERVQCRSVTRKYI